MTNPTNGPPPDSNFVRLNFDGSVINQGAPTSFVIRNENGEPILAGASRLDIILFL